VWSGDEPAGVALSRPSPASPGCRHAISRAPWVGPPPGRPRSAWVDGLPPKRRTARAQMAARSASAVGATVVEEGCISLSLRLRAERAHGRACVVSRAAGAERRRRHTPAERGCDSTRSAPSPRADMPPRRRRADTDSEEEEYKPELESPPPAKRRTASQKIQHRKGVAEEGWIAYLAKVTFGGVLGPGFGRRGRPRQPPPRLPQPTVRKPALTDHKKTQRFFIALRPDGDANRARLLIVGAKCLPDDAKNGFNAPNTRRWAFVEGARAGGDRSSVQSVGGGGARAAGEGSMGAGARAPTLSLPALFPSDRRPRLLGRRPLWRRGQDRGRRARRPRGAARAGGGPLRGEKEGGGEKEGWGPAARARPRRRPRRAHQPPTHPSRRSSTSRRRASPRSATRFTCRRRTTRALSPTAARPPRLASSLRPPFTFRSR
jgi:hypothetical protein